MSTGLGCSDIVSLKGYSQGMYAHMSTKSGGGTGNNFVLNFWEFIMENRQNQNILFSSSRVGCPAGPAVKSHLQ